MMIESKKGIKSLTNSMPSERNLMLKRLMSKIRKYVTSQHVKNSKIQILPGRLSLTCTSYLTFHLLSTHLVVFQIYVYSHITFVAYDFRDRPTRWILIPSFRTLNPFGSNFKSYPSPWVWLPFQAKPIRTRSNLFSDTDPILFWSHTLMWIHLFLILR